jgi:hypothetical protein
MARFEFCFVRVLFGAKLIDVLVAVLLMLSTISSRSIETGLLKITDELPKDETDIQTAARESVFDEFLNIVKKLSEESVSNGDGMQADQPTPSETGKNDTRNKKELNPLLEW